MVRATRITVVILELIRAPNPQLLEGTHLLGKRSTQVLPVALMIHDNLSDRMAFCAGDASFEYLPYQLSMVG